MRCCQRYRMIRPTLFICAVITVFFLSASTKLSGYMSKTSRDTTPNEASQGVQTDHSVTQHSQRSEYEDLERAEEIELKQMSHTKSTTPFDIKDIDPRVTEVCQVFKPCVEERKEHMDKVCMSVEPSDWRLEEQDLFQRLVVDDEQKVVFCDVPVLGKIQMPYFYSMMNDREFYYVQPSDRDLSYHDLGLSTLHTYTDEEQELILKTYKKVIIVQHPLDKFWALFRMNHTNLQGGSDKLSPNVLSDFIKKQITHATSVHPTVQSISTLCQPCHIHYDMVLKLESAIYESIYMVACMEPMTRKDSDLVANVRREKVDINNGSRILHGYQHVGNDITEDLLNFYHHDMEIFDYSHKMTTFGDIQVTSDDSVSSCALPESVRIYGSYP